MESLELNQSNRRLRAVRLAITVGLAMLFLAALLCGLREVTPAHADPGVRYVDGASGSDTTDCTNPDSPCATIGYALDQAEDFDTILVAQGTYTENLVITKTITLEGGYEPGSWSRRLDRYTTIDGNQSARVINVESTLSETTMIDGFTITNGDGGIRILLSSVAIQNSKIVHNHTRGSGGGMLIDHSYVYITNTLIADNTANNHDGAMRIVSATATPGPYSRVRIYNSTIANNRADNGRNGIFCSLSSCSAANSIVWGHEGEDFSGHMYGAIYSCIEMGLPGEGNISEDPRFVDPGNGDYHLRPCSPCIDAGNNEYAPLTDWEGDPRPFDGDLNVIPITDMGADEFNKPTVYPPHIIFSNCPGLDQPAAAWDIYPEGSPNCADPVNVSAPSPDGNALRCAVEEGSEPYGNCHYYRNLISYPWAKKFIYSLSFRFTPTTTCNNDPDRSIIQALEFSMSKWDQFKRYEFALQWQNVEETVGDGAPQWRLWCPPNEWVPLGISQCLAGEEWHTLVLEGEIVDEQVHYQRFVIDDQSHTLTRICDYEPSTDPDKLAVAIQLDGNSGGSPYDVFVDGVLLWLSGVSCCLPGGTQ